MDFSIIVPVYNRAGIVKEMLPHILEQETSKEFEVIVVDDGSTDDLAGIMTSFSHPALKFFSKQNGERGAARNFGARQSKGKYLNFFDCDDLMYPNHLETAARLIEKNPGNKLFHVCYHFRDDKGIILSEVGIPSEGTVKHLPYNNFLACNTVFVEREVFLNDPFSELRELSTAEDWELWLRLVSRHGIVGTNEKTFAIVEHKGRSLNTIPAAKVETRNLLLNSLLKGDLPFNRCYKRAAQFFYAHNLVYIALIFAGERGSKHLAKNYLRSALREYPLICFNKRFLAVCKNLIMGKKK